MVRQSLADAMAYPGGSEQFQKIIDTHNLIPGCGHSFAAAVRENLKNVSLWSLNVLDHSRYEYIESFKQVC